MAIFQSLARVLRQSQHSPESKFVFLPQISAESVRMCVCDNRRWDELHLPSTPRHSVGQLDVLGTGHRERCVVALHRQKMLAAKCGGVCVDEVNAVALRHEAITIFIFELNKSGDHGTLMRAIDPLGPDDIRFAKWLGHRIQPIRSRNAVVIGKQQNFTTSFGGTAIAGSRRSGIRLANEANNRALPDDFRDVVVEPSSTTSISTLRP